MIERVQPGENNPDIHFTLGNIRDFTSSIDEDDFFGQMVKSGVEGDLRSVSKFLIESEEAKIPSTDISSEVSSVVHPLLKRLRTIPPFYTALIFPLTIDILGEARVATPEIKEDLLDLFRAGGVNTDDRNKRAADLRNALYAAEALGKLYGKDISTELLEYRTFRHHDEYASREIGQPVELYNSAILQGVMLGLGESNTPEGVREIFEILTMRNQFQFYGGRSPLPPDVSIYHREYAAELIDTAPDALSRTDEDIVRSALENHITDQELAALLTAYHSQGTVKETAWDIYGIEPLFKLALPYLSASKAVRAMTYASAKVKEAIVRFAPYGLRADIVDLARSQKIPIPNLKQWDAQELRRKQQKLNSASEEWEEKILTDQEIVIILEDIDQAVKDSQGGAIGSMGATRAGIDSIEIKDILLEVPILADLIRPGNVEVRIAAARKLQSPKMQKQLLKFTNNLFMSTSGDVSTVTKILVNTFRLNQDFVVKFLCKEVLGNPKASQVYNWKIIAPEYLGLLADQRALPYLARQVVNSPIARERSAAVRAVRNIGDPWSAEFLFDTFKDTNDSNLKSLVIGAIGGMKADGVIEFLRSQASKNKDKELYEFFIFALVRAEDREVIDRILTHLDTVKSVDMDSNIQVTPQSLANQLWHILLPKAKFTDPVEDESVNYFRNAIRHIAKHSVKQLLDIRPEKSTPVGRFRLNQYGYYGFYDSIAPLFDRLTAIPVEEAQKILNEVMPEDEKYAQFLFAMLTSIWMYPTMRDVLDFDRTRKVIANLGREEAEAYRKETSLRLLPENT